MRFSLLSCSKYFVCPGVIGNSETTTRTTGGDQRQRSRLDPRNVQPPVAPGRFGFCGRLALAPDRVAQQGRGAPAR